MLYQQGHQAHSKESIEALRAENQQLKVDNDTLMARNEALATDLEKLKERLSWFEEQLKLGRQRRFTSSTETSQQLSLFDTPADEKDDAADASTSASQATLPYTRRKRQASRGLATRHLPREQRIHDMPAEERYCECGRPLHHFGDDCSEEVEHIPEQLRVIEHVRRKYACRACDQVTMADKPALPIPKSIASASLLAQVITQKYHRHWPLYRQAQHYQAQGLGMSDGGLNQWVHRAAEALAPLREAFHQALTQMSYLQVDETPVQVLDQANQGYMWCYLSPAPAARFVLFDYTPDRRGQHVIDTLANFQGYLQSDGFSGYVQLRNDPQVQGIGCMAHCRRKFFELVKVNPQQKGKAHQAVSWLNQLYKIERQARDQGLSAAERQRLRQDQAQPILDKMGPWLEQSAQQVAPKSALGRAIQYARNQWSYLTAYIHAGEVEIDNNWVENQIRPFALGRKNWLFKGHKASAQRAALLYSLIQSCVLNQLNPYHYLTYVLNQVHAMRRNDMDPAVLLPHRIDPQTLGPSPPAAG